MTEPSKLVENAIGRLNTNWNSVTQRAMSCNLSHNLSWPLASRLCMTACDSIRHAAFLQTVRSDVHRISVGRVSVFHAAGRGFDN